VSIAKRINFTKAALAALAPPTARTAVFDSRTGYSSPPWRWERGRRTQHVASRM